MNKASITWAFLSLNFISQTLLAAPGSLQVFQDQYVNRGQFIQDSIQLCQKIMTRQWPITAYGELGREPREFIQKMTESHLDHVDIYHAIDDGGIGSLYADVSNPQNRVSTFNLVFENGLLDMKLNHKDYVFESIISVKLNKECQLERANLSFFNKNESIVLRQWVDSQHQVFRELTAKEAVKPFEQVTGQSKVFLQEQQNQFRVLVAILDQGVDYNHPKLAAKMRPNQLSLEMLGSIQNHPADQQLTPLDRWFLQWAHPGWVQTQRANQARIQQIAEQKIKMEKTVGKDFLGKDERPYDYSSSQQAEYLNDKTDQVGFDHGTHVADIASRSKVIRLLPLRIANGSRLAGQAIEYAYERGARIVNLSMGSLYVEEWQTFHEAVRRHPDMLFLVAAGNESQNLEKNPTYPAAFTEPNMMVVASVGTSGKLSTYSNYGSRFVHIAALGEDILAAVPGGKEGEKSGTSMATPQVTRVAAEMMAANPQLRPTDIIEILMRTATPQKSLKGRVASGILNEKAALQAAGASESISIEDK